MNKPTNPNGHNEEDHEITIRDKHKPRFALLWLKPFFCRGCGEYQNWEFGCANSYYKLCGACWEKAKCKVCGAAPNEPCDGGLHG